MGSDFALSKLQEQLGALSEPTPEAQGLLAFANTMSEAEVHLRAGAAARQAAGGPASDGEEPEVFKASGAQLGLTRIAVETAMRLLQARAGSIPGPAARRHRRRHRCRRHPPKLLTSPELPP